MNDFLRMLALGTLVAAAPVQANNTPVCDSLDDHDSHGHHIDLDENLLFDDGDLVFKRDGEKLMVITEDRELFYAGKRMELTPRGQELVNEYYASMDAAIDGFVDLAGDAAGLGISAAVSAIAHLLTGGLDEDEFEREVEAGARKIEEQADRACSYLLNIERIEAEMVREIPGFQPVMFAARTHSI